MSAITPMVRPANLLLIASIVLFGAVAASAPAAAQPLDFARSARSVTAWLEDLSRWLVSSEGPTPPEAGTCIDPNGKPRPCDESEVAPPGAQRQPERAAPRN
jgi:hypothetical protein